MKEIMRGTENSPKSLCESKIFNESQFNLANMKIINADSKEMSAIKKDEVVNDLSHIKCKRGAGNN